MKVKVTHYGGKGYNWANQSEHIEFVGIEVIDDDGKRHFIDESFKEGEYPYPENRPSEILPELKERAKHWLYKGDAKEFAETAAWMEERIDAIDLAWLEGKAADIRARAAELTRKAEGYEADAAELRKQIGAVAEK